MCKMDINYVVELYLTINNNFTYSNYKIEGFKTNSKLWHICEISNIFYTNASPAEALKNFLESGGKIDCRIAISLVQQLLCLCKLGKLKYNKIMSSKRFTLPNKNVYGCNIVQNISIPNKIGKFGFITNINKFSEVNPFGFDSGQNIFCIGKTSDNKLLYIGFGNFIKRIRTLDEIKAELWKELNITCNYDQTKFNIEWCLQQSTYHVYEFTEF